MKSRPHVLHGKGL